jgi:hypothetical protein
MHDKNTNTTTKPLNAMIPERATNSTARILWPRETATQTNPETSHAAQTISSPKSEWTTRQAAAADHRSSQLTTTQTRRPSPERACSTADGILVSPSVDWRAPTPGSRGKAGETTNVIPRSFASFGHYSSNASSSACSLHSGILPRHLAQQGPNKSSSNKNLLTSMATLLLYVATSCVCRPLQYRQTPTYRFRAFQDISGASISRETRFAPATPQPHPLTHCLPTTY